RYARDAIDSGADAPQHAGRADIFRVGGRPESQRRGGAPREMLAARKPPVRTYHRSGYLTDGKRLIWEYPRDAGAGEQMDFVEVMELDDDGLIRRHCVYWAGSASGCCSATNILVEVG